MGYSKEIQHLKQFDPALKRLIESKGACTLEPDYETPFAALCEAILYQQLTAKAAATITERFKGLFGKQFPAPGQVLGEEGDALRGVGISRSKLLALRDLAQKTQDGTLDFDALPGLDDAAVVEHLTRVHGIGPWTAEMFLIFNLGRLDVFPVGDYGIRKGIQQLYGYKKLPAVRTMLRHAKAWEPYRTLGTWYLWRLVDD